MEILPRTAHQVSREDDLLYRKWFAFADEDGDGRLTGQDAVRFFSMSNLTRDQLKRVWAIADIGRQGFLGYKEFVIAMQVISLAQAGHEISVDILRKTDTEIKRPELEGLVSRMEAAASKNAHVETRLEAPNGFPASPPPPPPSMPSFSKLMSFTQKKFKDPPTQMNVTSIVDGLRHLYMEKVRPLESTYRFQDFVTPLLTNSDFDAKPMVMLLGQYSTGKTTFIHHILQRDYPGAHIGPEPTTDRFVVIMHGQDERSIPGNTIAVQADMPFNGLTKFGGSFLSKFECSQMPHPLLEHVTFVDTPGVLSGEKQRTQRSYDFTGVIQWFASKCDLVLLLFDPHKLDISDEFKRVIMALKGHDDKIRVVLNKAHQVDTQQLMRVYGALMWSLGKVLNTPEVVRVYIGSFHDREFTTKDEMGKFLFDKEQNDLLADLKDIPRKSCDRKINEFVKRARAAIIHAYIIAHLKKQMPAMLGKAKAQEKLIDNLEEEFAKIQREHRLAAGDFPNVHLFRDTLEGYSIDKFEKLKPRMIQIVDEVLSKDIPDLLRKFRNPYESS
eukprot:TRINITY_DN5720_c1_g1_i1.p1 TRINITY_DN5720_c1_g1~~TRINITY_DN5720_c1_g1_i1.p1  ORF type:complete len:556 (-),score=109.69 TRINITY_DN5720_c1_g1_i1:1253-2920(-)